MKPSNLLISCSLVLLAGLTSCKKESTETESPEITETIQLTTDQGTADYLAEDDNDVLMEAAEENDLLGNFAPAPLESNQILQCATITVTPLSGFPKTITVDFGPTNCVGPRGVAHRGKIIIVISDSLRHPGSTAVMTFENYFVNNFKREGTHTWTNTSTATVKSWRRQIQNGKITSPDGRWWLHNSTRDVVHFAGANTPRNLFDDVFRITGHGNTSNSQGGTRSFEILHALQKKYICANIDMGRIRFESPNHFAILDYGDGTCDRLATISINGNPPRQIILH